MNTYLRTITMLVFVATIPALVFGYAFTPDWIIDFIKETNKLAARVVPLLLGIALVVFIWGVVRFISTDDDKVRAEGKSKMVWSIIALFVIVSVWGLVALLQTLAGIRGAGVTTPQSYFGSAPLSSGGGGSCTVTTDPCPDGSGWSCASPCCSANPSYPIGCESVDE